MEPYVEISHQNDPRPARRREVRLTRAALSLLHRVTKSPQTLAKTNDVNNILGWNSAHRGCPLPFYHHYTLGTAPSKCGRNLFKKKKEKGKIPVADDVLLSSLPEGRRVKLKNRDKHFFFLKKRKKTYYFA